MHEKSDSFKSSKILIVVFVASLSIITTLPSFTTAEDIPEEVTSQGNPYKHAFFGKFDDDWRAGDHGKAFKYILTRAGGTVISIPKDVPLSLYHAGKDTAGFVKNGLDGQEDSGPEKFGRFLLSPIAFPVSYLVNVGQAIKENPVQSTLDAATYAGVGLAVQEITKGKSTNNADGGSGGPGAGGGAGGAGP